MLASPECSKAMESWGQRTVAIAYLHSGEERFLDVLIRLMKSPHYVPADADYFKKHPDLHEDPAALDFEALARRSREILRPGPSVRTIIYTYRVLPAAMAALRAAGLDENNILPSEDSPVQK